MNTTPEPESPASVPPPTPCSCNQGRVMLGPSVWSPCAICDGTGDRSKNRNYRDGWNAALATARAQGEQSMRDAVLRWHHEQWTRLRAWSDTNAFAGAFMTAHERSIAAISALNVDNEEQ